MAFPKFNEMAERDRIILNNYENHIARYNALTKNTPLDRIDDKIKILEFILSELAKLTFTCKEIETLVYKHNAQLKWHRDVKNNKIALYR